MSNIPWQELVKRRFENVFRIKSLDDSYLRLTNPLSNSSIEIMEEDGVYLISLSKIIKGKHYFKSLSESNVGELTTCIAAGWENEDNWEGEHD